MNNASVTHFKRFLAFSFLSSAFVVFFSAQAHAGALVNKAREAQVGNVAESGTSVSLQSQYGAVPYPKDGLMWYSTASEVDTLFKAGQKALSDGSHDAAQILFEASVSKEPATEKEARGEIESLKTARFQAHQQNTVVAAGSSTELLSPEEKITRGKEMIARGKEMASKQQHFDSPAMGTGASTANQTIADGQKLVAQGEKELKALQDKKAAEVAALQAKKQEMQKANQVLEAVQNLSEWTQEEKYVNAGVGALFGLIVMGSLWGIVMKKPAEGK